MVSLLKTINETLLVNGANQYVLGQAVPGIEIAETVAVPTTKIEMAAEYLRTHPKDRKLSSYDLERKSPIPGVHINRKMWDRAKSRVG